MQSFVTLKPKFSDRQFVENYRPVLILSTIVFEFIIVKKLTP